MSRLVWDEINARELYYGVDKVVVYPHNRSPVVWNGIKEISEEPEDADATVYYYDGDSYVKQRTAETFAATIRAITYPDVLDLDEMFDLVYRVQVGNGYDIHLVYNARLSPTQVSRETIDDTATTADFQWKLTAVPEPVDQLRAVAHVIVNTEDAPATSRSYVTDLVYGTDSTNPRIPHLPELISVFETNAVFQVVDHGDGSWTATGPDEYFEFLDGTSFIIKSPSARWLDSESYRLSNW